MLITNYINSNAIMQFHLCVSRKVQIQALEQLYLNLLFKIKK